MAGLTLRGAVSDRVIRFSSHHEKGLPTMYPLTFWPYYAAGSSQLRESERGGKSILCSS